MEILPVIEVAQLFQIVHHSEVKIFEVTNGPQARENFDKEHLKGAFFLDLETELTRPIADYSKGGRHPLPDTAVFLETLSRHGISQESHVIVYDRSGGANAAARFWWMLKAIGHEKVQVLNGGFQEAKRLNFPLSDSTNEEENKEVENKYDVSTWQLPTISIEEVEAILQNPNYLVIDVRDPLRYEGVFEPIDSIAGHLPGAINLPFKKNLDAAGKLVNPQEIRDLYENIAQQFSKGRLVVHCGSGVTACHTLLAFAYAGLPIPILYVGSWSEWSRSGKEIRKKE